MTVLAKTGLVRTKTEFNFIAAVYRHTQYLSIPSNQVLNVNWSTFLKVILPTLQTESRLEQWHPRGAQKLGSEDLDLLPLAMWPTGVSLASPYVPSRASSIINPDGRKERKNYHEIQLVSRGQTLFPAVRRKKGSGYARLAIRDRGG